MFPSKNISINFKNLTFSENCYTYSLKENNYECFSQTIKY